MEPVYMARCFGWRWRARMRQRGREETPDARSQAQSATGAPPQTAGADRGFSVHDGAIPEAKCPEGHAGVLRPRGSGEERRDDLQDERRACEGGALVCMPGSRVFGW